MRLFFSKHELKLRRKRTIAAVVCMVIVLGVYWILTRPQKAAPEMPTVIVEPVIKDDVEIFGEYVGRIRAQQFVEVRARVEGYLENMLFAEGTYVNKNQVLFVINQDQYRAKADKARAQLKKDEAQALKAERDLKRIRPLYEQNAASQLDLDNAEAAYESAVATVAMSEADLAQAELELGYTIVRSPLAGHISERNVDLGTLVGPGGKSLLATVVKSDTVLVDFSMTALDYLKSKERNINLGQQDSTRSWQPNITITLADNTVYPYKGYVDGFSSASFTSAAIDSLMRRGEEAARAQWNSLIALKKEIGIPDNYVPKQHGPYSSLSNSRTVYVTDISFSGVEADDKKWLMKKCNLKENSNITTQQIEQAVYQLRGSHSYSSASYTLTDTPEGYHLNFLLEEKYEKRINLGIRFDSEEIASLLINATADLKTHVPSRLSLTGRLGKRYAARIDYTLEPMQQRNFNFSYMFQYNDINIYDEGERAYNTTYKYHLAEFGFSDVWYKNLRFGLGLRFEYYKYKDFLFKKPELTGLDVESEHFLSYFAQVYYSTFDKGYFPSKGTEFKAAYSLYTDNMAQYNDHAPFSALSGSWASVVPVTRRFSIIPSIYGRVLIGKDIAYPLQNAIGGEVYGLYIPQQLPFAGVTNMELMDNSIMIASVKLRQRMGSIHYLTLTGNYGLTDSHFFEILKGKQLFGISAGYGMDSMFGPLEITFGYSNQTDKGSCYVNLGYYF